MNDNEYGDGGINWFDLPDMNNSSRHRVLENHNQQGHIGNPSPEIIDQAYKQDVSTAPTVRSNSTENDLKAEIQRLHGLLLQKDDNLFSLESSLATVEVEAKHAISLAESSASMKVRQLEEDIRRITKEADIARLDIIRTKQVHQQQIQNMQQQIQQAKTQPPSAPPQHERIDMNQMKDDGHNKERTAILERNELGNNKRQSSDYASGEMIKDKLKGGIDIADNNSQHQTQMDSKLNQSDLQSRKDPIIHRSLHVTSTLLKQSLTFQKEKKYGRPLNNRVEFIKSMIANMASVQSSTEATGSFMTIGNLVKEMIRALVLEFENHSTEVAKKTKANASLVLDSESATLPQKRLREDKVSPQSNVKCSHPPSVQDMESSLESARTILRLFTDLLSLSTVARKELRACISSGHYTTTAQYGSFNSQNRNSNSSSIRDPARVISRIRGMETLKDSLFSVIMDINEGAYGCDVSDSIPSSLLNEECRTLCTQLVAFISDLIVGRLPSSISFQVEACSFLLAIMLDACPETSKSSLSDDMITSRRLLIICFPYLRLRFVHGCRDLISILESDLESQHDIARRRYNLLSTSTNNSTAAPTDTALAYAFESFKNVSSDVKNDVISLKIVSIQLLSAIIHGSRTARDTIIHNTIQFETDGTYRPHVTHARRITAAIVDELQVFVLPLLSVSSSLILSGDSQQPMLIPALALCKHSIHLISVLCEFDLGFELVRTRMKSLQSDGSVKDSLPAFTIIADCLIVSGRVLIRHCDESSPTVGRLPMEWSALVGELLLFFKLCLSHVQRLHKLIDEGHRPKRELISFNAILCEAGRKESFCSICRTLLVAKSSFSRGVIIEEDSYQLIMSLLNEIAFDEEDEKQ